MVECDSCLTWIHITCTDLKRRDRVPEVWHCYKCVEKRNKAKGGGMSNIQVLRASKRYICQSCTGCHIGLSQTSHDIKTKVLFFPGLA